MDVNVMSPRQVGRHMHAAIMHVNSDGFTPAFVATRERDTRGPQDSRRRVRNGDSKEGGCETRDGPRNVAMRARLLLAVALSVVPGLAEGLQPSILFVVADDLGWQDLGWREVAPGELTDMHGATDFLDTLAAEGVKLDQLYVGPVCSPTRAQLMTGQYGVRIGFLDVLSPIQAPGILPLDVPSLAEGMRGQGYATGLVGKWHVGFADTAALPINRGWDKAFNYYGGVMNYFTKRGGGQNGFLDIHDMGGPDRDERHVDPSFYSGFLWQERTEQIIREHAELGTDQPLFMYYAMQNPHGAQLLVPDEYRAMQPCASMADDSRQIICGMVSLVNENMQKTHTLMRDMLDPNYILILMADNGGNPSEGGYNMPLLGSKGTMFDGGVRSASFIWSESLAADARGSTYRGLIHVTDWLPTLMHIASSGEWVPEPERVLDGYNQWPSLISGGMVESPRASALLGYFSGMRGAALRWNTEGHEYKIVLYAQASRAVYQPVQASFSSAEINATTDNHLHGGRAQINQTLRGRGLMGGGGGGGQNGGANCSGNGNNLRCYWLFDLSVDDNVS